MDIKSPFGCRRFVAAGWRQSVRGYHLRGPAADRCTIWRCVPCRADGPANEDQWVSCTIQRPNPSDPGAGPSPDGRHRHGIAGPEAAGCCSSTGRLACSATRSRGLRSAAEEAAELWSRGTSGGHLLRSCADPSCCRGLQRGNERIQLWFRHKEQSGY